METFVHNISQVLGTSILHSLWQGLLIYCVVRLAFIAFPSASAGKKYNALYFALTAMAVWFGYTFFMEARGYSWSAQPVQSLVMSTTADRQEMSVSQLSQAVEQPFYYQYKPLLQTYLPYISAIYLLSLLINIIRLTMGWQNIRRIKNQAVVAIQWQALTSKLAAQAGIIKNVQIYFSKLVDVPCAVGYVKPILLLPVTISTQLSAEEIEVIILHELAHIKNNDYILNLIQQIMALLLFLNPFAQLISKMIDVERENRCDDTVVQIGDPLTYAGALVKLEKTRQQNLQLAMAATGKNYHLFDRVKRIMSDDKPVVNIKHLVFGLLIFISAFGSIAWLNPEIKSGKLVSKNGAAAVNKLAELVKEVITPVKQEEERQAPVKMNIAVVDSTAKVMPIDSTELKKSEREALLVEYLAIQRQRQRDQNELDAMPQMKEIRRLNLLVDSLKKINRESRVLPPELEREQTERSKISRDFFQSEVWKKNWKEYQRLISKYYDALQRQPEMIEFEKRHKQVSDSLSTRIMREAGITKSELYNNPEWKAWSNDEVNVRDVLIMKLGALPEIKVLNDSIEYARHSAYSGQEYEEYAQKTKASEAYMKAIEEPADLYKYRVAIKTLWLQLQNTALLNRMSKNGKRHDEIVSKLKQ